ncbi:carbamoyltransferase [Streptomyces sp. TRM66268-LWL]|uniref:Carbamoyltransferase n=1 Tax=Streptomyces polyasparticus TaxID=2767826 RepID=A0ABR7SSF5_9ACTN|nr:carbamoyltransferase C-terminal domain-containing protein [Streptomyces polyasparticus]MBC9717824.1 carbamoyltransferase [Streptomyces polyasparticus]
MPAVLGLNFHHDTSACLIVDGRIYAAEEERWTGIKHNRAKRAGLLTPPTGSLAWCLQAAGLTPYDIDEVWTPAMRPNPAAGAWMSTERAELAAMLPSPLADRLRLISHHTAHVLAGYLLSGEDHAAGLVIDAGGSALGADIGVGRERISGYDLHPDRIDRVHQAQPTLGPSPMGPRRSHPSLGHLYRNMAMRVIPPGDEPEGSMMALAALGDPDRHYKELRDLLVLGDNGFVHVESPWGTYDTDTPLSLDGVFWTAATAADKSLEMRADLAASAQRVFGEAVVHVATHLRRLTGAGTLVFSGGCALNSHLNGTLAERSGFDRLFVAPAPHDAGTAVGAALFAWHYVLGQPRLPVPDGASWGPAPGPIPVGDVGRGYRMIGGLGDRLPSMAARLLADHRIVGWVQGGLEFGPRALGHRSVLAHPGRLETRDRLNALKRRASYRPFAPVALAEEASKWFVGEGDPFMNRVVKVRACKADRVPGIVHHDGTARLQTVGPQPGSLRALLEEFQQRTELPVLINTSLNFKGTPILRTADQAVRAAVELGLDAAAIGDALLIAPHVEPSMRDSLTAQEVPQ